MLDKSSSKGKTEKRLYLMIVWLEQKSKNTFTHPTLKVLPVKVGSKFYLGKQIISYCNFQIFENIFTYLRKLNKNCDNLLSICPNKMLGLFLLVNFQRCKGKSVLWFVFKSTNHEMGQFFYYPLWRWSTHHYK